MNKKMISEAVKVINERFLTPVIYYLDYGYKADFVCFFEMDLPEKEINEAEEEITRITSLACQVVDIREFDPFDAMDIVNDAELVYSSSTVMEAFFKSAIMAEVEIISKQKEMFMERKIATNTLYIQ